MDLTNYQLTLGPLRPGGPWGPGPPFTPCKRHFNDLQCGNQAKTNKQTNKLINNQEEGKILPSRSACLGQAKLLRWYPDISKFWRVARYGRAFYTGGGGGRGESNSWLRVVTGI